MNSESPKRRFFARLVRNWLSLDGAILVVSSWFAFFLLLTLDFFAPYKNPYLGIRAVLRTSLPHADETEVRRLSKLAARARGLHPMPHRSRRQAVCSGQIERNPSALRHLVRRLQAADPQDRK